MGQIAVTALTPLIPPCPKWVRGRLDRGAAPLRPRWEQGLRAEGKLDQANVSLTFA